MAQIPNYLSCLKKCKHILQSSDSKNIDVWELTIHQENDLLKIWADNFRQHYCPDTKIDALRAGTGLSRKDYLTQVVFPDSTIAPGPSIRSGDFAELLVSDYVEYILGYWIPRGKYAEKWNRNESIKGVDILGFRAKYDYSRTHITDTLIAFEVKAQLSAGNYSGRLQTAIDDSSKDYLRRAMTLHAIKNRLLDSNQNDKALLVQRFQNQSDYPYTYRSGAAAILSDSSYDETAIQSSTKTQGHQNASNLELIVIKGTDLMKLVHAIYEKAANEA